MMWLLYVQRRALKTQTKAERSNTNYIGENRPNARRIYHGRFKSILGDAYKEGMTLEEINKALEGVNLYEGYVKKMFLIRQLRSSRVEKKHNALLSEEERKEAERLEAQKQLEEKLASLERDKALSEHKAKFLGLGYDEALATETAEALVNGDTEKLFANQSKFIESRDKALKAKLLNDTPTPSGSVGSGELDYNKLINEAREAGDMSAVAYYTRLSQAQ